MSLRDESLDGLKWKRMTQQTFLQSARALGNEDQARRHQAELAQIEALIDERKATMNHEAGRDEIVAQYRKNVGSSLDELARLNAEADKLPADYVEKERARINREVDYMDSTTRSNMRAWAETAQGHAASERAGADAERDPQARIADELLSQRLSAGVKVKRHAEDLMVEARRLLSLGQPSQAAVYAQVAGAHGAFGASQLQAEVDEALDSHVPGRRRAKAIEQTVDRSLREFEVERRLTLAEGGLGIREDGAVGRGRLPDVARATGSAKDLKYRLDHEIDA